jgi:hypothetical protein
LRKRTTVIAGVIAGIVVTAAIFGAVTTKPADALPTYKGACSGCHTATPSGAVSAQPSNATLAPNQAYTVSVTIPFTNSGQYGARIDDASNVAQASQGPQAGNPVVLNMTAPAAAGTYTYTAWGVRSTAASTSGQAASATYQITVQSSAGGGGGSAPTTDTVAPTAIAQAAASVKKGKTATLKYKINDPAPNLGTATATITIKNAKGQVVKTLVLTAKPVNTPQKATFKATLKKGKYKFYVTAVDAAGNQSTNVSFNKLTVK